MKRIGTIGLFMTLSVACQQAYNPPVVSTNHAYLVVEGFINNGPDSTVYTLSHTYPIRDTAQTTPELGAKVTVEGKDNSVYLLGEMGSGNYGAALTLNNAIQYRLHIITKEGKEYASDYVPLKPSPSIDSINWAEKNQGVEIYANTHDPTNSSTYYRWNFTETWEHISPYFSFFQYDTPTNSIVPRLSDSIYYCWASDASNTVILGSSASLQQDVIFEAPVTNVPLNSNKLRWEYSINVKQYVLTPDAYNFWLNLQKNTELTGNLFNPQPSEIGGNIHSLSDSSEEVIGYVSGGTLQQQRIFIFPYNIPDWNDPTYPADCYEFVIISDPDTLYKYFVELAMGRVIPTHEAFPPTVPPSYFVAPAQCVDCRIGGYTNIKPSFWP